MMLIRRRMTQAVFPQAVILSLTIALLALLPSPTLADDDRAWGVDTSVGLVTDYMFRGKNVYEGLSFQPSVSAYYDFGNLGTLGGNVWLHTSVETNEPPEKFTELDYTLTYDINIEMMTLTAGHIFYTFPGTGERIAETEEYFFSLGLDLPLNPSVTFFNDYDEGRYQYYTLRISEDVDLDVDGDQLILSPYALAGFATNADDGPIFYDDDGLEHIDIGVSTIFQFGSVYFAPHLNFTFETDDAANNEFWIGFDLGHSL